MSRWDRSKKAQELRLFDPFGDKDKDRIANILDCQPFNPYEQGLREFLASAGQKVTGAVSTATTAVRSRMAAIKPVIKRYAKAASQPSSLSGLYIHEMRKRKEVKPSEPPKSVSEKIVSGYERLFAPARVHYKMVSELMKKPERAYETKIIEPVETAIMGEKPGLVRQTAAGLAAGALYYPIWRFSVGRVATEAIAEPRAFPKKVISYGKSMIGLAKTYPGYFTGSLIGMGIAGSPRLKTYAERLSPLYVSPKRITATPIIKEKMPSTGRVPVTTPAEILKRMMEEPTFKLTGKPEEVWHATPSRWAVSKGGVVFTAPGRSATKGVYVGPAAYPKFAVGSIIEAPRRVRTPPTEPTLYSIITRGIEIPKEAKVTKSEIIAARRILGRRVVPGSDIVAFAKYKRYVERIAPKGYAYISPEATAKLPWRGYLEVEAVIPPLSRLKEPLGSRIFTRFTYVKVPRYRLTRVGRRLFKSFEKEWQKKFKKAKTEPERIKLRSEYEKAEAKLLKKLREEGELKQKGYEPVKVSVRRLVSSELSKEEIKKASEPLTGLTGRLEQAPRIEIAEFRAGEIRWRAPRRFHAHPFLIRPSSGIIAERGHGITERRISKRIIEPLRLPEQRRQPISERRKKREPERGRRGGYEPPARRWLIPERGRGYERYPPREERPPRERRPPIERIPPVIRPPLITPPRQQPKLTTTKQKPKKRYKKQKKEWEKYYRIAPIAKPEEILSGSLKLLGGRR